MAEAFLENSDKWIRISKKYASEKIYCLKEFQSQVNNVIENYCKKDGLLYNWKSMIWQILGIDDVEHIIYDKTEEFREERIVSDKSSCANAIYDPTFIHELTNIEEHENALDFKGNMVHYVISGRSVEAVKDMTGTLMQSLLKANRVSSRRMEVITEIEPDMYDVRNHLEDILDGNNGGVIVIDLTEKFGYDPVDYTLTSKYILHLLKKYRNKILFVFTYNIDNPGFSYQILPEIKKYIVPIMLREGRGDRRAAIKYMKTLIKSSKYAEYDGQAGEFMKLYPGNDFTQTDVLMAYEKFESWCLNKNILHAYNYDMSQRFMLDRDETTKSSYDKLTKLIGLDIVKKQIDSIIASDLVEKERIKCKGKGIVLGFNI